MVGNMQKAFEDKTISLYPTRRMSRQLIEVRKVFSTSGKILYRSALSKEDTGEENYRSHADLFWALAMCVTAAQEYILSNKNPSTTRSPILRRTPMASNSAWSQHSSGMLIPSHARRYGR